MYRPAWRYSVARVVSAPQEGGFTPRVSSLLFLCSCRFLDYFGSLFAHHGNAAFDAGKKLALRGTVTEWVWADPHCWLKFDVKDDKGNVVHLVAETNNTPDMIERGWSMHSFKTGDEVTVPVKPVKNGNPVGRVLSVVLPNGQILGMAYLRK
jgi:Family of unknown function (DUF6152)